MRKKTIYVLATVMCMSIFTACGSTNRADAGNEVQQEVQKHGCSLLDTICGITL